MRHPPRRPATGPSEADEWVSTIVGFATILAALFGGFWLLAY